MALIDLVQQVVRIIHNSKLTKNLVFVLYLASLNKSWCYQKRKHKKNVVISRVYSNFKMIKFLFFYQNNLLSPLKYYLKVFASSKIVVVVPSMKMVSTPMPILSTTLPKVIVVWPLVENCQFDRSIAMGRKKFKILKVLFGNASWGQVNMIIRRKWICKRGY